MNAIVQLMEHVGEHGKDTRINVKNVLGLEGAPGLNEKQIWFVALACAYTIQHRPLLSAVLQSAKSQLGDGEIQAAQTASTLMAMNNIYYRAVHLAENAELSKLPAKLRMTAIGNPGVPKVEFELASLAVSALTGCGQCIGSHVHELQKHSVAMDAIQSGLRIAAVLNAAAQALRIEEAKSNP